MRKLKEKIGTLILKWKLKKFHRTIQGKSFSKAQKAGILFNYNHLDDLKRIKKHIKELRQKGIKEVHAIGFTNTPTIQDHFQPFLGLDILTLKDVNFAHIPNTPAALNFIREEWDYLFVPEKNLPFPLKYLLALSKAKLKIGFDNISFTRHLDFMLSGKISKDTFFSYSEKYLNRIS